MENYPEQIKQALLLLEEMGNNSIGNAMWKNYPLAHKVLALLDEIPHRGNEYTPYDKILILDATYDSILPGNTPRFAIELLERILSLLAQCLTEDWQEDENPIDAEYVQGELDEWRDYIDIENITPEQWNMKYSHFLKFDPIERTPAWEENYYEVEQAVDTAIGNDCVRGMGFCFEYWRVKQEVLMQRGVEWHTPAQLNPRVRFD